MIMCSYCNKRIYNGEEYISDNENRKYIHFKCIYASKPFLNWLGFDIKTMEDNGYDETQMDYSKNT